MHETSKSIVPRFKLVLTRFKVVQGGEIVSGALNSIAKVAEDTGVSVDQLRYWEKHGLITCERKNNVRFFDESEYAKIKLIKEVLAQPKATLDDARRAVLGEAAMEIQEQKQQLVVTEEMVSIALDKSVEKYSEVMLGMASAFKNMQEQQHIILHNQEEMKAEIEKLRAENATLTTAIDKRLEERDRKLMETLRMMQENAQREVAAAQEQQRRRWWPFG